MRGILAFAGRALALLPTAADGLAAGDFSSVEPAKKGYTLLDRTAVIAIFGSLSNRDDFWSDNSYENLRSSIDAALKDAAVDGIVLHFDSPGGDAAGAMELAGYIRSATARKPVIAYVDSLAASAAYAIATGASQIVAAPSATLGSIGVVALHMDQSGALASRGLKPTILHAGAFKVDGNSLQPLKPAAAARIQSVLDQVYSLFTATVGKHRPKLGEKGARDTKAGLFIGSQAVAAGLADRLGDMRDAIALATSRASGPAAAIPSPRAARPSTLTTDRTKMTAPSHNPALANSAAPPTEPTPAVASTSAEQGRLAFAQAAGIAPAPVSAGMAAGRAAFSAALSK